MDIDVELECLVDHLYVLNDIIWNLKKQNVDAETISSFELDFMKAQNEYRKLSQKIQFI